MRTNSNRDEVEYQLQLDQRKKDAKTTMRAAANFMNGGTRSRQIPAEVVGAAKRKKNDK